ncbi:hypothetical protein HO133_010345 [Letharia lupina]|uniref:Uncharacterized protein n=1 Tax=Letharia lupina TaxID=560253 RepID=A0A8H6CKD7_9LECA|nr:uncharacterized protein HO133_010345 [Letharia lupina]KAF6225148.1 hypothetical protein HO133_010345 [Letharia lupina]
MNTATVPVQPGARGGRVLDMRDVILWQQEQAQRQGELGFTTNFPDPSEIFKPFTINPYTEDELPAEDRAAVVAAMQETHRAIIQLHQRKILMDGAGPLLASTEMNVNQKLLAAGVPEQELPNKSLRQKIVQLVELKEPPPKKNFAAVLVDIASTTKGRSHMLEVNLPLKAFLAEVYALLDEVVKALLSEKGLSYERGGAWKYQLVDQIQSQLLMHRSLPLETDLDYKLMLQQMSRVGDEEAPVAVLTQGGLARPINISGANAKAKARGHSMSDALEVSDEDDNVFGVLDEDGKPFFEPLDMDRMSKKYARIGDDLTEENGIHGFWR